MVKRVERFDRSFGTRSAMADQAEIAILLVGSKGGFS
jgi:hypothetical protein